MKACEPYPNVEAVVADRVRWSIAMMDRLIQRGRVEGWLTGDPRASREDPAEIENEIAARIAATSWAIAPMQWLASRLGLGDRELDVLWLLATVELSPAVARLAQVFVAPDSAELSLQILLELVPVPMRALDALQQLVLLETSEDPRVPQPRRPVRIHDRVLELARGELELDRELRAFADAAPPGEHPDAPAHLVACATSRPAPLVLAVGAADSGRATLLTRVAAASGHGTLRVRTDELSREPGRLDRQLRAIAREVRLLDLLPLFADIDADPPLRAAVETALRAFPGPVLATASKGFQVVTRPSVIHPMQRLRHDERRACWAVELGDASDGLLDEIAGRYDLAPGAIAASARNARALGGRVGTRQIQAGVRAYFGDRIGELATRIDWRQSWDDLVLPSDQFEQLVELVARVRHRGHVLDAWGFGDKVGKGNGVAALFSGPPGTGKTMVGGLIASELDLDLYQVDLSKVVSKYIGETEKSLAALFDAAEAGHALLLFDEADALFGKRTDVKSSNDRYANLEVNYLLQRIEAFRGIVVLTTNHEKSIDAAFRRRLAIHVRFPVPDERQREQLWRAMLPEKAMIAGELAFAELASTFDMSGGYIKNAVLRAAYLAAAEGSAITSEHLWQAARTEYEAMGKIVPFRRVA